LADSLVQHPWLTVFLSLLGSGLLSALVAGIYGLRAKQSEYVNDYYKTVVARRVSAYEDLEKLLREIKTAVVDESDNKPYHLLFCSEKDEDWQRAWVLLYAVMTRGLWLSDEVYAKLRELNLLIFHSGKPSSLIAFGKDNYKRIATLRNDLEVLLAKDMLALHDVPRFLKSKNKPDPGFQAVYLNQPKNHK
jgi:hypothetical protein